MKKGFTLIELLVVIAIIAILIVITVVMINPAKVVEKGKNIEYCEQFGNYTRDKIPVKCFDYFGVK